MTNVKGMSYYECPDCQYNYILLDDYKGIYGCALCAGDSGHHVTMKTRPATEEDIVEGYDARRRT